MPLRVGEDTIGVNLKDIAYTNYIFLERKTSLWYLIRPGYMNYFKYPGVSPGAIDIKALQAFKVNKIELFINRMYELLE